MNDSKAQLSKYRSLSRKMVITYVAVAVTPLILTGVIILNKFNVAYRQKAVQHLEELVQKHSQNIDRFLYDRLADIRMLARTGSVVQLTDHDFLSRHLQLLREEYNGVFVDIGLVDNSGRQVSYAGPFDLVNADYSQSDWFKKTAVKEIFISDVFTGLRGTPHFIVATKRNWEGRDWILRSTIDFEAFNSLVTNIRIGKTGYAFILNRLGELQTRQPSTPSGSSPDFSAILESKTDHGRVGVAEITSEGGDPYLVAMASLKKGQWLLCCYQDSHDAFSPVRQTLTMAITVFLIGGWCIITVALFLSNRMVRRLNTAEQEKVVMNEKIIEAGGWLPSVNWLPVSPTK